MERISILPVLDAVMMAQVEALAGEIWREHYVPIIGSAQVEYMLGKFQSREAIAKQVGEGYLYFIMREPGGGCAGYFAVMPDGEEIFLSKLYVASGKRGRGYGRLAVEFIEALAKGKGFRAITLTVSKNNAGSVKAYGKMGFALCGPIVTDIGCGFVMDDYLMKKVLPRADSREGKS